VIDHYALLAMQKIHL